MRLSRSNRMCQAVHEENSSSVALVPGSKTPTARLAECPAESMVLPEAAETPPFLDGVERGSPMGRLRVACATPANWWSG